jgi:HEAT repeat protein
MTESVSSLLSGGDRRSIGKVDQVVKLMKADASCIRSVVDCLLSESPVVRMRAADALEKFSLTQTEDLSKHVPFFLTHVADIPQQEVRWHMAQMLPRLKLSKKQRGHAIDLFESYLSDKSSIVRTWAMNGLAELAKQDPKLKAKVVPLLERALSSGTPAMKARARKIFKEIK